MNFFNSKNKFFLDMRNAKLISHAFVLVDNIFNGQISLSQPNIQFQATQKPFQELASAGLLKRVVKEVMNKSLGCKITEMPPVNPMTKSFDFDNVLIFGYDVFPPRFSVQFNTDSEKTEILQQIFQEIVDENVKQKIGAIGVNFELFVPNQDNKVKDVLLNDKAKKDLSALSVSLSYVIDGCNMNLQIADAARDGINGLYLNANFHNVISDIEQIEGVMGKNFLDIAQGKIEKLLG